MYEPIRGGTRGGAAEFKWSDVSADKDREHYLGHSINAPTGRWQKNKDVHWYNRDLQDSKAQRDEEIRKVKEAEADALAVALGFKPTVRSDPNAPPTATEGDKTDEMHDAATTSYAQQLLEKEERRRAKALKKATKEAKRAEKERRRAQKGRQKSEQRTERSTGRDYDNSRGDGRRFSRSPSPSSRHHQVRDTPDRDRYPVRRSQRSRSRSPRRKYTRSSPSPPPRLRSESKDSERYRPRDYGTRREGDRRYQRDR